MSDKPIISEGEPSPQKVAAELAGASLIPVDTVLPYQPLRGARRTWKSD